jgi:hypothetical protein
MMKMSLARMMTLAALLAYAGSGCGAIGSGKVPDLIPVKGKVTFKGKPLTKGTVAFEPDGFGRPARGELQSDGTFVLSTLKEGDGVVAGEHRVSITGVEKSLAKDRTMIKYASPNTSRLTAQVDREHTDFTLDLK